MITICTAYNYDIPTITKLIRQEPITLGYVHPISVKEAIARHELLIALNENLVNVGFIKFYKRKDGWNTIQSIVVDKAHRREGIGYLLLLQPQGPCLARVMENNLPAQYLFKNADFNYIETTPGNKTPIQLWERQ